MRVVFLLILLFSHSSDAISKKIAYFLIPTSILSAAASFVLCPPGVYLIGAEEWSCQNSNTTLIETDSTSFCIQSNGNIISAIKEIPQAAYNQGRTLLLAMTATAVTSIVTGILSANLLKEKSSSNIEPITNTEKDVLSEDMGCIVCGFSVGSLALFVLGILTLTSAYGDMCPNYAVHHSDKTPDADLFYCKNQTWNQQPTNFNLSFLCKKDMGPFCLHKNNTLVPAIKNRTFQSVMNFSGYLVGGITSLLIALLPIIFN